MALTNVFYEAVNSGNVRRIRIMMKDSLLVDPSFKEFKEMEMAAADVTDLYDIHDGRDFINDESKWDDDYMNNQMVQLVGNFSHERIEHLKDVVRLLRPVTQTEKTTNTNTSANENTTYKPRSYEEQKRIDQENGNYRGAAFAGGAVVGAVAGGIIASAAGATVLGGAVAGAVAGAVVGGVVSVAVFGEK